MLIIAPIYKVKPLKDVKLFPYVRISRNLALVSASRQEINQAFDHFYAKYIEDESTISSADPKGLKTDLAFQESLRVNHTFKHYFLPSAANYNKKNGLTGYRVSLFSQLIKNKGSKLKIQPGTFSNTQLERNSVDVIVGGGAIHHCPDLEKSFQEFFKILKPGGFVLLSDYSTHSLATESLRKIEFNSPNSTADYESKRSGLEFKTNKDILNTNVQNLNYVTLQLKQIAKCINIATRNNFLINLLQWVFFRLIRKKLSF